MSRLRYFAVIALIAVLSAAGVQPQEGANVNASASTSTYFEKAGVQFDVPVGWNVTESVLPNERIVTLQPEKGPAQILVSAKNVFKCDFQEETKKTSAAMVERVASQIRSGAPIKFSVTKTQVNNEDLAGVSLLGVAGDQTVIADVYTFRVSLRLISLVYVRSEKDENANSAWNAVRTSLKVEHGVRSVPPPPPGVTGAAAEAWRPIISGGVLNGKAIRLPVPGYPPIARQAHASGTVVVQVTIDEAGAVIKAQAVRGHPLLQGVCVAAAREAQFSPTKLCDEPVKVTGIITYQFVAQ